MSFTSKNLFQKWEVVLQNQLVFFYNRPLAIAYAKPEGGIYAVTHSRLFQYWLKASIAQILLENSAINSVKTSLHPSVENFSAHVWPFSEDRNLHCLTTIEISCCSFLKTQQFFFPETGLRLILLMPATHPMFIVVLAGF